MKKYVIFIFICLLISCNADVLMNNGEISKPSGSNKGNDQSSSAVFSKDSPTNIQVTKSFFDDHIAITWNAVKGAEYYTLEKCIHSSEAISDDDTWFSIGETINTTSYDDYNNLEASTYYSYRVTAHTLKDGAGKTSVARTGTILASPVDLSATQGTSTEYITVKWTQMPNVDRYNVYKGSVSSVSGLEGEFVSTINAASGSTENVYTYPVKKTEAGNTYYFAIEAIGPTGEKAKISASRSGYSRIEGSPSQPEVTASKGVATDSIEISFVCYDDADDVKYTIKRSYPGSPEETLFEGTNKDSALVASGDYYKFTDIDVINNIEYTYSVIATNDIGSSEAGKDTGYLLSPFKELKLVGTEKSDGSLGYQLKYTLPVGADTSIGDDYKFEITVKRKNGNTDETLSYSVNDFISNDWFYQVDSLPSREAEQTEVRNISIAVVNSVSGNKTKSTTTNTLADLLAPVLSISATQNNKPYENDQANGNGVYPVHIKWENDEGYSGTRTITRKGSDGAVATFEASGTTYDDTSTNVLTKYDYYIDTRDELGRTLGGEVKHATDSYGAVTFEVYKVLFESLSLKPWEVQDYVPNEYKSSWKSSTIATLIGYGNSSSLSTQMQALGSAEATDHFRGGKVTYNASMEGVGGQIYFTYSNFGENINFYTTGNYEMHVNASGNGSAGTNTGGFTINGMYPGHIGIGKISVSGKNFSGSYTITYNFAEGSEVKEVNVR